jgi:GMP synthase-like glutamine amidotransferase
LEPWLVPADGLPHDTGDLLIIMGGPMSVNDADPWIAQETDFIRSALLSGMPVVGVCLGSQFMAKALGAAVRPGKALEIGMTRVRLTPHAAEDPVFGMFPKLFEVFEWHGEVFDLPAGCVPLAGSEVAPLQAFRFGNCAYGLLFHLEMDEVGIDDLCRHCAGDLARVCLSAHQVKVAALPHLAQLHAMADRLISHLLTRQR